MGNYVSESTKADPRDGKKKVTPKTIYEILSKQNKQILIAGGIVTVVFFIVFGIFALTVPDDMRWGGVIKVLLIAIPVLSLAIILYSYYNGLKMLSVGGYKIITDKVERVVADDRMVTRRHGSHTHTYMEHAMYMEKCGRVVITLEDTYTNSEGDIFYMVVTKKHPRTPVLKYNSKYYELEDLEIEQ